MASLEVYLAEVDKIRTHDKNGVVSIPVWLQADVVAVVASLIKIRKTHPYLEHETIVYTALCVHVLNSVNFQKNIDSQIKAYQRLPEKKYTVCTSISVRNKTFPGHRQNGVSITYTSNLPVRLKNRRTRILSDYPLYMCIQLNARSEHEAQLRAVTIAEEHRAILALHSTSVRVFKFGHYSPAPVGSIRYNDFTVHQGKDILLYKDQAHIFDNKIPALIKSSTLQQVVKFKSLLRKCKYAEDVCSALHLYIAALDAVGTDRSFLLMWAALETLTTPGQADYNLLIKRCLFLRRNGSGHQEVLEHLKKSRNDLTHRGTSVDNSHTLTYQTQDYVREIVSFHLSYAGEFSTLADANLMLDLPVNVALLKKAIQFLN
jgi:hypothetical protein